MGQRDALGQHLQQDLADDQGCPAWVSGGVGWGRGSPIEAGTVTP